MKHVLKLSLIPLFAAAMAPTHIDAASFMRAFVRSRITRGAVGAFAGSGMLLRGAAVAKENEVMATPAATGEPVKPFVVYFKSRKLDHTHSAENPVIAVIQRDGDSDPCARFISGTRYGNFQLAPWGIEESTEDIAARKMLLKDVPVSKKVGNILVARLRGKGALAKFNPSKDEVYATKCYRRLYTSILEAADFDSDPLESNVISDGVSIEQIEKDRGAELVLNLFDGICRLLH